MKLPNPQIPRKSIVPECMGCDKIGSYLNKEGVKLEVCAVYANPKVIHRLGCGVQTNKKVEETKKKKWVNPLKASKRRSRRK